MFSSSSHMSRRLTPVLAVLLALSLGNVAVAEAAGPKLKSARAMDADSDGRIDAFNLRFSGRVRGRAQTRAPFAFRVSGYRVTRVERPRGLRVRVHVAEGAGCDLGARPIVSYRPRRSGALTGANGRRLRASRVNMARGQRGAARVVCALTADADRDGRVDAVVLTYSRRIRYRGRTAGPFPFQVDRFAVRAVEPARGRTLTLRLRERSGYDTDEIPAVIYRRPAVATEGVTARGGSVRSSTFNATRDGAAAVLVSTSTADADQNGLLDGIDVRFSEPVSAAPRSFTVTGATVTGVSGSGRERLTARIAEGPFATDARPTFSHGARGVLLRDAAGNFTSAAFHRPSDGAAPVIASARTEDRGGVTGRLDTLVLAFSEDVTHAPDSDGAYPFGVTGYSVSSAGAASGPSLELTLVEGETADSGSHPTVGYTRGVDAPVRDAAGNEAATRAFGATTDGVIPRLVGASTVDADTDGRVDAVAFDFSEPVRHAAADCPGCSFSVDGGGLTADGAATAAGSSVLVSVSESAYNTGVRPIASYSPVGAGVTDESGNAAQAATATASDGAPPVAVSAATADADADARIDRITATFSEPMDYAGDTSAPFALTAQGYTLESVDATAANSLTLRLQEAAGPDTGSAPELAYAAGGDTPLRDQNGTEHAARAYPGLTRDAVAPVFLGAATADSDAAAGDLPGRIDAIDLRYSEALQGGSDTSPFAVSGRTVQSVGYGSDRVAVRVAEGPSPDTGDTPSVTYTPPGAPGDAVRLRDLPEGAGDTADEAPPVSSWQAADAVGPTIVAARTGDADGDGKLDRMQTTFSAPIDVAPGLGQVMGLVNPTLEVTAVAETSATVLTATATEPTGSADGDLKPGVVMTQPDRVTDAAGNFARAEAFSGASDGVRPVLLSARSGEASGADCLTAAVNGFVDCVRARWSEPVQPPSGPGAFSLNPFAESGVLTPVGTPDYTDLTVTEGASPDRDVIGSVTYAAAGGDEVVDLAGNTALDGSADIGRACIDTALSEPNDARALDNPELIDPVPQQALCAGDPDWFRAAATNGGRIDVVIAPATGLVPTLDVVDSTGTVRGSVSSPGPGAAAELRLAGLTPGETYWLYIRAPVPQEGDYCLDITPTPGETCDAGEPLPG